MKKIPLTQNKFALIDDEDYSFVSLFKWTLNKHKYINYAQTVVVIDKKRICFYMHRLILNSKPYQHTDHINHNGLDNRRKNLRKCTCQQNNWNRNSRKNTSSRHKGVSFHKPTKKWQAYIFLDNKKKHLGLFISEKRAAQMYNKIASKYHGEFAKLNNL